MDRVGADSGGSGYKLTDAAVALGAVHWEPELVAPAVDIDQTVSRTGGRALATRMLNSHMITVAHAITAAPARAR